MKLDKRRWSHWCYLLLFSANIVLALLLRWWPGRASARTVVLYGHKFSGNLLAIFEQARADGRAQEFVFLTMDPAYHRVLARLGLPSVLGTSPACIPVLARMRALISDHGLHSLELMRRFSGAKFFDVWHGIPFKGFDADDFRVQRTYDEVWVASPLLRDIYRQRFGFDGERLAVTGYARTDRLLAPREPLSAAREYVGLAADDRRRIVLFAPTWKQDAGGRSIFPFGVDERRFMDDLETLAARHDALILFRAHLNSGAVGDDSRQRVLKVPHGDFPDTELVLRLADALVCDWSSIAFDFLLLDRPTIFLDVEAPFRKGFSLGPEYRFGAVVGSHEAMLQRLDRCLAEPASYASEFSARHARVREEVYGEFADGHSAARCLRRLDSHLLKSGSSR